MAAVFVSIITATYYSRERIWSTPYTLVYGEPFPDESLVVPFGCGALVLLDKDNRCKFKARCALLSFLHYATSHPLYTYAFFSPHSKRVLYCQDAIFLVTTFPMRSARANSGLPTDGEPLVAVRSPLALDTQDDSTFQQWKVGDALPDFDDHVTGESLVDDPNFTCADPPDVPPDWPRRYPYHPSFGSPSTVPVPVPTLFPSPSRLIPTALPVALDPVFSASWDARASSDLGDGASSSSDTDDDMRASTADTSALELPVPFSWHGPSLAMVSSATHSGEQASLLPHHVNVVLSDHPCCSPSTHG